MKTVLFVAMSVLLAAGLLAGSALPSPVQAEQAAGNGSAPGTAAVAAAWTPPSPGYRVLVDADGMYQLTYDYLSAAGLPVASIDPRSFRLFWMGQEVPIQVTGEEDGAFNDGNNGALDDAVVFYGRGVDSLFYDGLLPTNKYTGLNNYFLTYGGPNGLRMATKDGSVTGNTSDPFLHREHLEKNSEYKSAYPFEQNADHWYGDAFQPIAGIVNPKSRNYTFAASYVVSGATASTLSGTLRAQFLGFASGTHHLKLYMNNVLVFNDNTSWSGYNLFDVTAPVPQSAFKSATNAGTTNTIKVEAWVDTPTGSDQFYLNWLDVLYYDTYVAESNSLAFRSPAAGARQYSVSNFGANAIEVYDVTDHTAVQRVISTTVTSTAPYAVSFGDDASADSRYVALTPAARKTPKSIAPVSHLTSSYTPAEILATNKRADYIIITHADFWSEAQTLARHRARSYFVALVDAQEVYDRFNGGMMSAEAIHDFLAYAYANWQKPAPAYVVLIGDGTWDMRRYVASSPDTYVPPYLYLADSDLGETAVDNRYVTLVGNDNMPEMHIGRLPVNTAEQAADMLQKIIDYENPDRDPTKCTCGAWQGVSQVGVKWNENLLFVADDQQGGGGDFHKFSDAVAESYANPPDNTIPIVPKLVPANYTVTKAYLGQQKYLDGTTTGTCDLNDSLYDPSIAGGCRAMITNTLTSPGALLVSFVGHSTETEWAAERLLDSSALATLNNGPCLPIMLPMTCYEGSFHNPNYDVLAETSTRAKGSGAVASWSPTGFGLVTGHDYLERGLFQALFNKGINTLGAAITDAKQYLLDEAPPGKYNDLLDTFVLIGDPALEVKTEAVCATPTAVQVAGLRAQRAGRDVRVSWETASEVDVLAFNILRSPADPLLGAPADGDFAVVNAAPIFATWSGSARGAAYAYLDEQPAAGQVYALEVLMLDGSKKRVGLTKVAAGEGRLYLPAIRR